MSGGSTPAKTDQVSKVELPPWVSQAGQDNYNLAKQVADRPLDQYPGDTVATPSDMTTRAWDAIRNSVGQLSPFFNKASGVLDKAGRLQNAAAMAYGKQSNTLDSTLPMYDKAMGVLDQTNPLYAKQQSTVDSSVPLFQKAAATVDETAPIFDKAGTAFDKAGSVYGEAGDIYRGTAGPLDIQKYLNPYTQEVEDRAVANANTSLDQQVTAAANKARASGAFGGSRGAIEQGVTRSEGVRSIGDLTAQLRKAGFDVATDTALKDRSGVQAAAAGLLGTAGGIRDTGTGYLGEASGKLGAAGAYGNAGAGMLNAATGYGNTATGLQNEAAGIRDTATGVTNTAAGYGNTGAGLTSVSNAAGNTAAGILANASARQGATQNDISNLTAGGSQETANRQAVIDAAVSKFNELRDYPLQQLNTRLAALGMTPYGKTETTNKTATSENKGPDWASILLGVGGLGIQGAKAGLFSDETAKTDIEKLSGGDIPMYAYRYKGDPKTYPKVVGPMAQDVKKKFPKAVFNVGGKKAIDLQNLMESLS